MSSGTTGKMSLAAAGGFTILGVALTVAATFIPGVRHFFGPSPAAVNFHAKIKVSNFTPDPSNPGAYLGTCEFKANHGGGDIAYKFPGLSSGDTIDWTGTDGRPSHHDPRTVTVNFPNSAAGSPFFPAYTFPGPGGHQFPNPPVAPSSTATEGDYTYDSIVFLTDDNLTVRCSNATDPGVHVNQ